ncbi:MAG: hypothetical protein AABY22_19680 [Nanoarchaeota archaeon]
MKEKKPKHIPLDITLQFTKEEQLENLKNDKDFKKLIFDEVEKTLVFLSENKSKKTNFFIISNLGISISVVKKNYKKLVDSLIVYHTEKENYAKCSELTKLKEKL